MLHLPVSIRFTHHMLLGLAFFWLAFAVGVALSVHPSYPAHSLWRWPISGVAAGLGTILGVLAVRLRQPNALTYWLTVLVLAVILVGGLLDELGWADAVFLLVTALPLALLLKNRSWYLTPPADLSHP